MILFLFFSNSYNLCKTIINIIMDPMWKLHRFHFLHVTRIYASREKHKKFRCKISESVEACGSSACLYIPRNTNLEIRTGVSRTLFCLPNSPNCSRRPCRKSKRAATTLLFFRCTTSSPNAGNVQSVNAYTKKKIKRHESGRTLHPLWRGAVGIPRRGGIVVCGLGVTECMAFIIVRQRLTKDYGCAFRCEFRFYALADSTFIVFVFFIRRWIFVICDCYNIINLLTVNETETQFFRSNFALFIAIVSFKSDTIRKINTFQPFCLDGTDSEGHFSSNDLSIYFKITKVASL